MNVEQFIDNLAKNVFPDTSREQIEMQTEYMELEEWTSMTAFSLISYFESEFGKKVTLPELLQSQTINDLYNLISK